MPDVKVYRVKPVAQADVNAFKVDPGTQLSTLIENNLGVQPGGYYLVLDTEELIPATTFEAKYEEAV